MPARRSTNRFHEREVTRALRAAKKSGTAVDRLEIDPASGKISMIISKPDGEQVASPAASEWDKATEDLQRRKSKDK